MDEKMERKGNRWFNAMKKVIHAESKENSTKERAKSNKKWFPNKKRQSDPKLPKVAETATTTPSQATTTASVAPPEPTKSKELERQQPKHTVKLSETTDKKEQTKHAYNVTTTAAAEVVRLTAAASRFAGKSEDEIAAIKIQSAFRGYMGRRTLRALKWLMRLKTAMQGQALKSPTTNTLKCMQTLARVQTQVQEKKFKMSEENQARKREIRRDYEKDQPKVLGKPEENGDEWNSNGKTKDDIEAKLQIKHEAAMRRQRTMAYAYTHQQAWKPTPRTGSSMSMDPKTTHQGWSWLERWLAARPWETATVPDNVVFSNENSPRILNNEEHTQ